MHFLLNLYNPGYVLWVSLTGPQGYFFPLDLTHRQEFNGRSALANFHVFDFPCMEAPQVHH